ncbi:MAG: tRNA (adenosine(37)-N6)-threonylcarbamoyltransferase complex ATPase subunit type 1 TsaE [Alphaproteobacteria bacterium]|nr:tRNA (adenosine(37)-N6)-threonylcarbamoyltransferase complex ATPase subunit type 1 TsaE [Alphaproteobacteria bacterium]
MIALALDDVAATHRLAETLAEIAGPGMAILLSGPLGAGKSEFARAFVRAWLADPNAEVPSPTFTLVQPYDAPRGTVWHCDLYRLGDPSEVEELGLGDAFADTVALVEWPDRLGDDLPADRLELTLEICHGSDRRIARLTPHGRWAGRLDAIETGTLPGDRPQHRD